MPLLEIKNITQKFGGLVAVDDFSLEVNEGEIVSVIGPNGAGKTTVFNVITGVYTATSGQIAFDGDDITKYNPRQIVQKGIIRTFQNIRLFKGLRVIENALIGAHINVSYSIPAALLRTRKFRAQERDVHAKAVNILNSLGLGEHIHAYAGNLPYGLQRRLEIARAIMSNPKILLLDEPAAGMNPQESQDLMEFINGLRDDGFTILLIEHDMSVVMGISDRIYVMDYGKLIAHGLPAEIVQDAEVIKAYLGDVSEIVTDDFEDDEASDIDAGAYPDADGGGENGRNA